MLCAVGDLVEDVVVLLAGQPMLGTDTTCTVVRTRGGSAANVAVAAARTGSRAAFIGAVGADRLGDELLRGMADAGVEFRGVRGGRTGSVVVLVDPEGERTMLTDRGSANELPVPDSGWLDGAAVLHAPAYSLAGGALRSTTLELWSLAADAVRSVDASSVALLQERGAPWWRQQLVSIAPDVLFADASEAAFLGIADEPPSGCAIAVVKDGRRPARVLRHDHRPVDVAAIEVEDVVDTTGAGDAFAAGWLVARTAGADPVDATLAAHRLAAEAVLAAGALT